MKHRSICTGRGEEGNSPSTGSSCELWAGGSAGGRGAAGAGSWGCRDPGGGREGQLEWERSAGRDRDQDQDQDQGQDRSRDRGQDRDRDRDWDRGRDRSRDRDRVLGLPGAPPPPAARREPRPSLPSQPMGSAEPEPGGAGKAKVTPPLSTRQPIDSAGRSASSADWPGRCGC